MMLQNLFVAIIVLGGALGDESQCNEIIRVGVGDGTIESPGYPTLPGTSETCIWQFDRPAGVNYIIYLNVVDISLTREDGQKAGFLVIPDNTVESSSCYIYYNDAACNPFIHKWDDGCKDTFYDDRKFSTTFQTFGGNRIVENGARGFRMQYNYINCTRGSQTPRRATPGIETPKRATPGIETPKRATPAADEGGPINVIVWTQTSSPTIAQDGEGLSGASVWIIIGAVIVVLLIAIVTGIFLRRHRAARKVTERKSTVNATYTNSTTHPNTSASNAQQDAIYYSAPCEPRECDTGYAYVRSGHPQRNAPTARNPYVIEESGYAACGPRYMNSVNPSRTLDENESHQEEPAYLVPLPIPRPQYMDLA